MKTPVKLRRKHLGLWLASPDHERLSAEAEEAGLDLGHYAVKRLTESQAPPAPQGVQIDKSVRDALEPRAAALGISVEDYAARVLTRVAVIEPDRQVTILGVHTDDYNVLRTIVRDHLGRDTFDLDDQTNYHLEDGLAVYVEEVRQNGKL